MPIPQDIPRSTLGMLMKILVPFPDEETPLFMSSIASEATPMTILGRGRLVATQMVSASEIRNGICTDVRASLPPPGGAEVPGRALRPRRGTLVIACLPDRGSRRAGPKLFLHLSLGGFDERP